MTLFDKINKDNLIAKAKNVTDIGKRAVEKVSDVGQNFVSNAAQKLAYSEEDIAERKAKDGIVYVFDGGNGTLLEVYEDRVTICHNKSLFGAFAGFAGETVGEKTLYATDITSVEFKEAQKFCIGYIRFAVLGGSNIKKTTADAAEDPNAVPLAFVSKNSEAAEIKKYIEKMIRSTREANSSKQIVSSISVADEIKKYKELADLGIITQEEFDAKKKQLLGL